MSIDSYADDGVHEVIEYIKNSASEPEILTNELKEKFGDFLDKEYLCQLQNQIRGINAN